MVCSYCNSEMEIKAVRLKRPAPAGAKDLDLYDDCVCWQCGNCGQTSEQGLGQCNNCKVRVVKHKIHGSSYDQADFDPVVPPGLAIPLELASDLNSGGHQLPWYTIVGCTDCTPCHYCHQPLRTRDYRTATYGGKLWYFHHACSTQLADEQDAITRKKAKLTEAYRADVERREAVVKQREAAGVCAICGDKFGLFEKGTHVFAIEIGMYDRNAPVRVHARCKGKLPSK